ncbi:regulator [Arcobacter suis]|uniref:Multi-sensor domain-containing two-component system response regulator c-di-GMP phosphodiesterase, RpfG family n=1 Tax=Arcobacter suis CECT 7833 TaxID=663365 RepID=A0AAD0WQ91_9BACT|nr:PAS domain S-box protein [Arcobacter suis]AXX89082.1 multi-sensor domain-containing two-component system response regulator c-di-GMP phosphodiesterase, RpfG family [Arcobacter suis CECT 7833]RWS47915.1 regulator [Arcobacter suis]
MSEDKDFFRYLKKLSLLYVEDDENTREELEYFLKNKVKKLYVAKNGQEGFDFFEKYQPDLIITDIQMPVMTGTKMIKLIKEKNKTIPIVIITAFNDTDYLFEAIKLNVTNYLTKPLNLFALSEVLANIAKNITLENENKEIYNSLKQYKDIVDERSIISKADINGIITYINEPFEKISGYKKEELLGKPHSIITHPAINKNIFKKMWKKINIEKKSWQGRLKNISKEGNEYFVDIIIKPILDLDGNIIEFISLSNDITDLETTKEYFKTQTQKSAFNLTESIRIVNAYKEAINESNIILRIDLNKNIVYANEAFYKISAYTKEDLIGKPYSFLKHYNLTQEEQIKKIDSIFNGNIWKGKISNFKKNGQVFHCDVTMYPLKNKDEEVIEYMGIHHDITDIERLHDELEDAQREIIYKLGEIGECRSSETGQHVKRVAEYSKLLAIKIGLDPKDVNKLFMASPMHDIGKVGIPDSILNKNGKLDSAEWEVMKTHAKIGYEILRTSKREILRSAAIVSYSHHERWDGSGYPLGLKGEDIHIFGRITAIADVFDALSSARVYKKSWALEDVLKLFNEEKGKHFDPNLIDVFMDNLDEILQIKENFKDIN